MKISPKLLKTARLAYLYADGHAVLVHRKQDVDAGEVEWVTIHEKLPCEVRNASWLITEANKGRLIVHRKEALAMILKADAVAWRGPAVDNGSEATRAMNLALDTVALDFGAGWTWHHNLPGKLSGDLSPQPDAQAETWSEVNAKWFWGDRNINGRFDAEGKPCERDRSRDPVLTSA